MVHEYYWNLETYRIEFALTLLTIFMTAFPSLEARHRLEQGIRRNWKLQHQKSVLSQGIVASVFNSTETCN